MPTIYTKASRREEIERLIRSLPGMLAGKIPDAYGIVRGFKLRIAFAFFSIIKENFIVKSRGGTDEAGIKWPPLSEKYLAYVRPMGRNGRGSRKPPHAGKLSPGGNDGFMSKAQLKQWRKWYAGALKYLALQMPIGEAKARAAAIAWSKSKAAGVRTKLEVFGRREVEILRDRGILYNSLSPGVLTVLGADASYAPPAPEQVVRELPDGLLAGTNVEYAAKHHLGDGVPARPLWPPDGDLPEIWVIEMAEVGASGLERIGELFT